MKSLFDSLNGIVQMSPALEAHLRSILQHAFFKKDDYILKIGQINSNIYFIESGFVRIYYKNGDTEVTSWFLKEGDIFISVKSFFRRQESTDNIVALEDCACWFISYDQLEETCRLFPEFYKHRVRITEDYYCKSQAKHEELLFVSADERYAKFLANHPELAQRIPVQLLRTYLGVGASTIQKSRKNSSHHRK